MDVLISVIIPAHNSEKTLYKCCSSIIGGIFQNFEIIIVENHSSDNTLDISEKLSNEDKRIKVVVSEKAGPAAARNIGMINASGKYFAFIDSDDYVASDYLSTLYDNAETCKAQLSICGYGKNDLKQSETYKQEVLTQKQAVRRFFESEISGYVWDKLFDADIIRNNNLYFPENMQIGEDRHFVLDYLCLSHKIVINNKRLYCYVQNEGSLCNQQFSQNRFDLVMESIYEFELAKLAFKEIKKMAVDNIIKECIRYIIMAGKEMILTAEQYNFIKSYLGKYCLYFTTCRVELNWKVYGVCVILLPYESFMKILKRKRSRE